MSRNIGFGKTRNYLGLFVLFGTDVVAMLPRSHNERGTSLQRSQIMRNFQVAREADTLSQNESQDVISLNANNIEIEGDPVALKRSNNTQDPIPSPFFLFPFVVGDLDKSDSSDTDVFSTTYKDFDITKCCRGNYFDLAIGPSCLPRLRDKWQKLSGGIPCLGVPTNTIPDYKELEMAQHFVAAEISDNDLIFTKQDKDFFLESIVGNTAKLGIGVQKIPDKDCLFYKKVNGERHLFLRLSSKTRKEAKTWNQKKSQHNVYVGSPNGTAKMSAQNIKLDHASIRAGNVKFKASEYLQNRASQIEADHTIDIEAKRQRNFTDIKKWRIEERSDHSHTIAEGIARVDECRFKAQKVIQRGEDVENYGILIEADEYEDLATHTTNMPAKITLFNYAWAEKNGWFSHAESSVKRTDDVLIPTRYHVNYYTSQSSKKGSSVKFGYTMIMAGSQIRIFKDIKEDVVVDEEHTLEIHEEKSGFSFFGGVKVPDPTKRLNDMHRAYNAKNMIGLTTSTIGAVAKGIQMCEDYKKLRNLAKLQPGQWTANDAKDLFGTIAHFVNGPKLQFGRRTVDVKQHTTIGHGNTMTAPEQIYDNPKRSVFAGNYKGTNITIRTNDLVTRSILQTADSKMSVHDCGISMDLLSFASVLLAPQLASILNLGSVPAVAGKAAQPSVLGAAAGASSINVSFQNTKTHQEKHLPTVIEASNKLDIRAERGHLTQAQIKAGIVHAVFTKDCVLETLANESWQKKRGGSISFSADLTQKLRDIACSTSFSSLDSQRFERVIDDFAYMVGEKKFYLKVGGILQTQSAFVGHKTHDPKREHIEAKERRTLKVKEEHRTKDRSFDLAVGDLMQVSEAIGNLIYRDAIANGASQEDAAFAVEEFQQELTEEKEKIDQTADDISQVTVDTTEEIRQEVGDENIEKLLRGEPVSQEDQLQSVRSIREARRRLEEKQAELNNANLANTEVQQAALSAKNVMFLEARKENIETELRINTRLSTKERLTLQQEWRILSTGWIFTAIHPIEASKMLGNAAIDNLRQFYRAVVNDPDIQAFWQHLDMVPGATFDLTCQFFRAKLQKVENWLRYVKDVWNDPHRIVSDAKNYIVKCSNEFRDYLDQCCANGPIEGTLRVIYDGALQLEGALETAQKIKAMGNFFFAEKLKKTAEDVSTSVAERMGKKPSKNIAKKSTKNTFVPDATTKSRMRTKNNKCANKMGVLKTPNISAKSTQMAPVAADVSGSKISTVTTAKKSLELKSGTPPSAAKFKKHRIFPKKFKEHFEKAGININDHCVNIEKTLHQKVVHSNNKNMVPRKWNDRWENFFESNPNATQKDIYQFGGRLMDEFGINRLKIEKYK